jgi:hydrogenase 3 maturation protease
MTDFIADLDSIMSSPTCIVGIGNTLRGDDSVGCYIAERLESELSGTGHGVINAEDIIESYVFRIADSDYKSVILIDALLADSPAGSVVFGKMDDLEGLSGSVSTHKLSLKLSGKILKENLKETYLVGIVARQIDFGEPMSPEVKRSADILTDCIIKSAHSDHKGVLQ